MLKHLTFGCKFNQLVNNLPALIKIIDFTDNYVSGVCAFDKSLNNLSNSICKIKLPLNYNQEIEVVYQNLGTIYCSYSYPYIEKLKLKKNQNKIPMIFLILHLFVFMTNVIVNYHDITFYNHQTDIFIKFDKN